MKVLYLECKMGAAGDMLMSCLSELVDQNEFLQKMQALQIPHAEITLEKREKCGVEGSHIVVKVDGEEEVSHDVHHEHDHEHHHHHHAHTSLHDVEHILSHLNISDKVRKDALEIYVSIAKAESHAHGKPIDQIHFHEVGTIDAIVDVVGNCILMEMIHPDRVICSNVALGNGMVHCAHGILPVPTPATAYLVKDMPVYAGRFDGELLTPTGAAILKHFVQEFSSMPVMKIEKIGYGMGNKDFEAANCVRGFLGESDDDGEVVELICNIDDMSSEEIGYAVDLLFEKGALDVYTTSVHMKKNRPGILFTCMCKLQDVDRLRKVMFQNLTTLGIREYRSVRVALNRHMETLETSYGTVRKKISEGQGVHREKLEYEDLAKIAKENHISIQEAREKILKECE